MFWEPERTRKTPPRRLRELIFNDQGGRCMYCGIKLDIAHMTLDHKTAFANSGTENPANFQIFCGPCNRLKSKRNYGVFRRLYKLGPSRGAKPPTKAIPRSYFNDITKELKKKTATKKKTPAPSWYDFIP